MQTIEAMPDAATGHDEMEALNKVDFGRRFNVSKRTVDAWIQNGLPHLKLSPRMVRLPITEASQWVKERYMTQRGAA